jgi:hypothetical protein
MWQIAETREARATPEAVWALWADVENWNLWDVDVEYSRLSGPFEAGTAGVLKSHGGPKSKFKIVEATERRSFTNRSRLPLCTLEFVHEVRPLPTGVSITHRVVIRGFLAPLFARLVGRGQQKNLPRAVETLAMLAESAKFAPKSQEDDRDRR